MSLPAHQNDLERATDTVREMITRYGMSDELGPLTFGKRQDTVFLGRDISQERNYSEAIAYAIDKEARAIMDEAYNRARQILTDHIDALHQVAAILIEKETIEAVDFYRIMSKYPSASTAMAEAAAAALSKADEEQQPSQLDQQPGSKPVLSRRLNAAADASDSDKDAAPLDKPDPDIHISFGGDNESEQDKN